MEALLAIAVTLAVVLGVMALFLWRQRGKLIDERDQLQLRLDNTQQANIQLDRDLAVLKQRHADYEAMQAKFEQQLGVHIQGMATKALTNSNTEFLRLAEQKLKPVTDLLNKYNTDYQNIEKSRKEDHGGLKQVTDSLKTQTESLVTALRRPEVRGKWGEIALRRILELSGMTSRCDFFTQTLIDTDEGKRKPDVVVHLPNNRVIVIDAKIALDAFMEGVKLPEGDQRKQVMERHVEQIRSQVKDLASKQYSKQFDRSPDFVVLFLKVESALYAAMDVDESLLEQAWDQKIIIATPTLLIALLRAVEVGWREEQVAKNAQEIFDLASELCDRLHTSLERHFERHGKALRTVVESYQELKGSLERGPLVTARRIAEKGVKSAEQLHELLPEVNLAALPTELHDAGSTDIGSQ